MPLSTGKQEELFVRYNEKLSGGKTYHERFYKVPQIFYKNLQIFYEDPKSLTLEVYSPPEKVKLYYKNSDLGYISIERKILLDKKERLKTQLQKKEKELAEINKKEAEIMKLNDPIKECEEYTGTHALQALEANNSLNKQVLSHKTTSSGKKVSFDLDKNIVYKIHLHDAARELLKSLKKYLKQKELKELTTQVKKEISDGKFSEENLRELSKYEKEVKNTYLFGKISEILMKICPHLTENEQYEKMNKIYSLYCSEIDHQHLKEFEKYAEELKKKVEKDFNNITTGQSLFFPLVPEHEEPEVTKFSKPQSIESISAKPR